ncbi:MAG: hemolysin activation protein [Alloprevotella sp.]|nr:hemolysin activation protein [Prevotella sp.]MBR1712786.1 hemolysin activation protein [Alloprevotella sp.]
MLPAKTDIAVLILFFNRPDALRAVFSEVRKARPSRLFLYQDGPRGEQDMPGINACRDIVADIDWECDVQRLYQERNFGCDPSEYLSQKWAFSMADKCIVLEDDDIPSQSFFPFCKELLDRYEDDPRISMITGTNYDECTEDIPYDYFFATTFSISGWASWRRVVDQWDEHYSFLDDEFNLRQLSDYIKERKFQQDFIDFCRYHRQTGKAYYETIFHAAMFFSSGLSIVPRVNMINNLGACGEGVHLSGTNATMPRAYRRIFEMGRHELDFPLRHPRYVIENVKYKERMFRIQGWGHPWIKVGRSFEELWLTMRHGEWKRIPQAVRNRVRKLFGKSKWD